MGKVFVMKFQGYLVQFHTTYLVHGQKYVYPFLDKLYKVHQAKWNGTKHAKWHTAYYWFNTLRPRQNGHRFADDFVKCIFLNENAWISLKISLKFVPKVQINHIPALVQIMAWRRPGDKSLSEPMMVNLLTHIWVIRPQWDNKPPVAMISVGSSNDLLHRSSFYWHRLTLIPAWICNL